MIKKPTSGDSEQREHEADRARRSSELTASGATNPENPQTFKNRSASRRPAHGSSDGESAHGAIPRQGIEFDRGD